MPSRSGGPELFYALRGYTRAQATADISAGVIVGIVALPLAVAFAIASGLAPQYGLYTAIISGFLISALGGSRVQIGGPTGAFIVIVYGIVQQYGVDGLMIATMLAGIILVVMGLVKLGAAIKFIPYPVTTGFTSGIAVVIATSQLRDLFGLSMPDGVPVHFVDKWVAYAQHLDTASLHATAVAAGTVAILIFWPRVSRRVPAPFVAIVAAAVGVAALGLDVETIGSRFGELSLSPRRPAVPPVSLELIRALIGPAFTIALLAGVESLLSAVVADGMIGTRHRSNTELVAQGIANIVTPLFGGMPATGAIARTATNVRSGGRTPVAGMVHAIVLLLVVVFFGRLVSYIPLAALAAILLVVAYHMSEWRAFLNEFSGPRSDVAVLLTTFLLTVFVDLTVAIEAGVVLAAFLFMRRMAEVTNVNAITSAFDSDSATSESDVPPLPAGVTVYEIDGPFFFGAAEKFRDTVGTISSPPRALILRMRHVPVIDSTGLNALRGMIRRARADGTRVMITEVRATTMAVLARSLLLDEIGEDNLFGSVADALTAVDTGAAVAAPPVVPAGR
jgi:sulfate permease, SulP family